MLRLGLCCLFQKAPIKFKTTTAKFVKTLPDKNICPLDHIDTLIQKNLKSLYSAILFCSEHYISSFRIGSGLFPLYTHPEQGYDLTKLPSKNKILNECQKIKNLAAKKNIRLTFHPDQFVVLSSPREDVVKNSLKDLEYHGVLAELLGADVINIHGGGGYGDKRSALERFAKNFQRLSTQVQKRLTLENDDRVFSPEDILPLCHNLNIPFVYDVHHHRCLPDNLSVDEATQAALATWDREPLFHLSSPKDGWGSKNPRPHSDFINIQDIPLEWKSIRPLTIEVEAKAKEIAVLEFRDRLLNNEWKIA